MRLLPLAALLAAATLPVPFAIAAAQALPPSPAQPGEGKEDARLKQLFHDSDEASLARNPISGLFRGDMRRADRIGDFYSDAYIQAERQAAESDLKRLGQIDRARLTVTNQIAYDVFRQQTETTLKGYDPAIVALTIVRPMDHFYGIQTFYPEFASGQGAAPFNTVADYENNLKRNVEYARLLDEAIGRFRQGMASGVVQPKLVVRNMIAQFDNLLAGPVEQSTFYGPVRQFPASVPAADQARLKAAYAAQIRDVILPAERRMRAFLADTYLPAARDSIGLSGMPGGDRLYAYLIEQNTTLPLKAEDVHQLGLSEVARILKAMEVQKQAVGFKGSLADFFTFLRTDTRFQPQSAAQLREGYEAIGRRIDARVREQFSLIPKTPLEIRPVPAFKEKTDAGGSYQGGTPDGTRPGVFYYNTYDLPSRYMWEMETLYLHEAVPGHHFQISLAQENAALPAFMRFGGNTAYAEGWALYAETLWPELGMETDPYQRMGGLSDEMLRAMRLVVDTGIHAKGWSRDQAIAYMLANSPMARTDATAEVERYIAIPGQALAYKIGQITISRAKAKAKAELGAKFDPRRFHAVVLDTGALPMPVLEKKIDDWIAAEKRRG
ncbi:uncharacterized protein (DUF885 family) [Sphingomonas sp. SORGH_AS 950]|uniref:DUF885 domain-containing protein n=1 Tax=Sphingomonas sp. SORGH_AS_0950 TaxID=3041792 RepID=UPI002784D84E|nr:DUF885 domain-containing protein [Sphingomonas sp. SORGH_AS_0950]MDQ1156239.1 uncharacterized protein (DUF885 family) [Sphingomonas sp. SORGH_AS_0950]